MRVGRAELESLPRWARVALVARSAMRQAPYFRPGALRAPPAAKADFESIEVCGLLAALAAVHGRQLDSGLAHTAAQAALSAVGAPNRVPLSPEDSAASRAALAVQMTAKSGLVADLDDPEAAGDYELLRRAGLASDQQPVPKEFFDRPLWTSPPPEWEQVRAAWKAALEQFELSRIYQRLCSGKFDWTEAQRRAEEWAREHVKTFHSVQAGSADSEEAIGQELQAYADALTAVIDAGPESGRPAPMVVAIEGPLGSGKAIVGHMLRRRLEAKPAAGTDVPHRTCPFNAWWHEQSGPLLPELLAEIVRACDRHRPAWRRFLRPPAWDLLSPSGRRRRIWVLAGLGAMAAVAATAIVLLLRPEAAPSRGILLEIIERTLGPAFLKVWLPGMGIPLAALAAAHYAGFARAVGSPVARLLRDPQRAAAAKAEIQTELGRLIEETVPAGCRMVVFLEELERCRAESAAELLNSLPHWLAFRKVVMVLAADRSTISAGTPERTLPGLQPLVQVALQLPQQRVHKDPEFSEGPDPPAMEEAFVLAFSRTLRGRLSLGQVFKRSLQVRPRWLAPYVLLGWLLFALPAAVYVLMENWAWPPACPRRFSSPGAVGRVVRWTLVLAGLVSFAAVIGMNLTAWAGFVNWAILAPGSEMRTTLVYSPLQFVNLAWFALLGYGYGWWGRRQERAALRHGRDRVAARLAALLANQGTAAPPPDWDAVAAGLRGCTGLVRPAEEILIQEAAGLRHLQYN